MSSSATPSRTTIALQNTAYHLVGCSAYMALLYKPLSCCLKHTPQYLMLLGPIILYLFILALHQSYVGYTEVMQNFKSAADIEKPGQRCERESNHTTGKSGKSGKSKRKNHRGGGKTKKMKSKREDTCTSTGSSNSGEN
ncbi:hypothetical protein BELL_0882g00010 [Botrytis elliptica]|uniref:Uncharacterized protein n=1 Tax=Botrytis elliptica TaxID=278938 RepID=A0A4Z1J7K5_9HELO|nr:hypothetical protein EAE99_008342 [Botrytis elliptica]TGO67560.1 hypothetical protein BELL_0882g00010 [Botrytis elliptica]